MSTISQRLDANKRFDFESAGYPNNGASVAFDVVEMSGREEISRGFYFELTLLSDIGNIDMKKMLAEVASLRIYAPGDVANATPYRGKLSSFEQLEKIGDYYCYRAVLVPRIWHLSQYRISEVYVDQQMKEMFKTIIEEERRLTNNDYELLLKSPEKLVPFACQYQETHFDFLSRWMEREGMYHFFTYTDKGEDKWTIVDDMSKIPAAAVAVRYHPDGAGAQTAADQVQSFTCHQKPLPNSVLLQDYNPLDAKTPLKVTKEVDPGGIGQVMLYGEHFLTETEGKFYADLRADELRCGGEVFDGFGTAVGLRSGHFFEMKQHYRDSFNGKFLLTKIVHEGSQAATLLSGVANGYSTRSPSTYYRNTFSAIRSGVQFRAQRTTLKPVVAGSFSATVDGELDDGYAELDDKGQYRVRLRFGRSAHNPNKASAPVRMASPYAGKDYGMHFPLHKEAEVLLSFMDGDIDRPVIMSAAPNTENVNQVTSKNNKVSRIYSAGKNLIEIDDTKGAEKITLKSPSSSSAMTIGGPEAQAGNAYFTAASSSAITIGATNKISVGPNTSITASTDTSISASLATKFALGMSLSYTLGQDIKWNSKYSKAVSIDDGDTFALKDEAKTKAAKSINLSAGHNEIAEGRQAALDAAKSKLGWSMAAVAGVNFAIGLSMATVLGTKGEQTKGKNTFAADTPINYGTMVAQMGATAIATGVGVAVISSIFEKVANEYKKVPCVSNMDMNAEGIRQHVRASKVHSEVVVSNDGVILLALPTTQWQLLNPLETAPVVPPAVAPDPVYPDFSVPLEIRKAAAVAVDDGSIQMISGQKIALDSDEIVLKAATLEIDIENEALTQKMDGDGVKFTRAVPGVEVTLEVVSDGAKMAYTGPLSGEVGVDKSKAFLQFSTAQVQANANGLALSLGGAAMNIRPVGVDIQGPTIKLG